MQVSENQIYTGLPCEVYSKSQILCFVSWDEKTTNASKHKSVKYQLQSMLSMSNFYFPLIKLFGPSGTLHSSDCNVWWYLLCVCHWIRMINNLTIFVHHIDQNCFFIGYCFQFNSNGTYNTSVAGKAGGITLTLNAAVGLYSYGPASESEGFSVSLPAHFNIHCESLVMNICNKIHYNILKLLYSDW